MSCRCAFVSLTKTDELFRVIFSNKMFLILLCQFRAVSNVSHVQLFRQLQLSSVMVLLWAMVTYEKQITIDFWQQRNDYVSCTIMKAPNFLFSLSKPPFQHYNLFYLSMTCSTPVQSNLPQIKLRRCWSSQLESINDPMIPISITWVDSWIHSDQC